MAAKQPLVVNTPKPDHPLAPQETITSGPPQVIVLNTVPQAQSNVSAAGNQRFKVKAGQITGGIQIACAVLSATFGIVALLAMLCVVAKDQCKIYGDNDNYMDFAAIIAWPIWGAVCFYGVAGIIGVSTGSKNTCVIVAYMVMSIMAALSAFGQVIMESLGAVIGGLYCSTTRTRDSDWPYGYHEEYVCNYWTISTVMHVLAAVVAFVEMIVAIVSAAYCCHGVCCRTSSQQVVVQYATTSAPQIQTWQQPPSAPPQYQDLVY